MIARTLLTETIHPLFDSVNEKEAYEYMHTHKIFHVPVINEDSKLCGLLAEEDIYPPDAHKIIGKHPEKYSTVKVFAHQHFFEICELVFNQHISSVPVVEENDAYIGLITAHDLIKYFTRIYSFHNPGAIIVLSVLIQDYSLSEISHIIEENDAKIISMYTDIENDSQNMDIIIKLNTQEISSILQTFTRYEYTVKTHFEGYDKLQAMYKERVESILNYINI
ncbi:MAG: CBS domain-containing protein [Bacteroidales bacterium]